MYHRGGNNNTSRLLLRYSRYHDCYPLNQFTPFAHLFQHFLFKHIEQNVW